MRFEETIAIAPGYMISRVIRGGWQLAGGHGAVDRQAVAADLLAFYDGGVTTIDCADIYTGVEEMIGAFRTTVLAQKGSSALELLKVHTKFVPDLAILPRIERSYVRAIIERSLQRLNMDRLDLVQMHWWDYGVERYAETAGWLVELQKEGKIDLLGATNLDTPHLEALLASGAPIRTLQVQYSLLDHRAESHLSCACQTLGVKLIAYGVLAGGFLSARWLGAPEPTGSLENRSLVKYKLVINEFGGWTLFQRLLHTLQAIAVRRNATVSAVAARFVLDKPGVAAVIVGARNASHLPAVVAIGALRLTAEDRADIAAVLNDRHGPFGEVYALERDRSGPHGSIMKYNLND